MTTSPIPSGPAQRPTATHQARRPRAPSGARPSMVRPIVARLVPDHVAEEGGSAASDVVSHKPCSTDAVVGLGREWFGGCLGGPTLTLRGCLDRRPRGTEDATGGVATRARPARMIRA